MKNIISSQMRDNFKNTHLSIIKSDLSNLDWCFEFYALQTAYLCGFWRCAFWLTNWFDHLLTTYCFLLKFIVVMPLVCQNQTVQLLPHNSLLIPRRTENSRKEIQKQINSIWKMDAICKIQDSIHFYISVYIWYCINYRIISFIPKH